MIARAVGLALAAFNPLLPLAPPAQAQAKPPKFNPSAVVAFRDSFALVVGGKVGGWHVYAMGRTADGYRFVDRFALGSAMHRDAEVFLDQNLRCLRGRHQGSEFGTSVVADMKYAGGRAVGVGLRRTEAGPVRVTVDTALADGVFDGLALMGLILTLDWRIGATYPLTIFDMDEGGSITTQTLRVTGEEDLTVPAGQFRAYRADLTTTQAPVRIWVTVSKPHRILKLGGEDDSFATVLVAASR